MSSYVDIGGVMNLLSVLDARSLARARRLELHLTQDEIARRIGTSRQWVVGFENGDGGTDLGLVLRLFAALGLALEAGPRPATDNPAAGGIDLDAHLRQLAESGGPGQGQET